MLLEYLSIQHNFMLMVCFFLFCYFFLFLVPPKILPFSFGEDPSNFGDSGSIQCSVTSGDLPILIEWFLNDLPIDNFLDITTSKVGKRANSLNIDYVRGNHAGNYSCQATNSADTVKFTTELVVNGIHFKILFF